MNNEVWSRRGKKKGLKKTGREGRKKKRDRERDKIKMEKREKQMQNINEGGQKI